MLRVSSGELLQCEATGNPDVEQLKRAAARRFGDEALKRGLLEIEQREVGGRPIIAVRAVLAKPGT